MSSDSELLVDVSCGVCSLTLNRPAVRNALTPAMANALVEALRGAANDPSVRAVVLMGAGDAFCAGGDVKAMAAGRDEGLTKEDRAAALSQRAEASRWLAEMPKPTIAIIKGAAAGAGLSLALSCDFRVAHSKAKLTTAFGRVGLCGDYGISSHLPKLVGLSQAKELMMLSPVLEASQALELGLLNRVWADDVFEAEAELFVAALANGPTYAFGAIKRNLERSRIATLEEAIVFESASQSECSLTLDHKEGAQAFAAKRRPVFKGQ